MDYELAYVTHRAREEHRAAAASTWPDERREHLKLAALFEEHAKRLERSASASA